MSTTEEIENLVLGGGEAGKYIAWELAKQGRPVMVIERALVGGSCPNLASRRASKRSRHHDSR